MSDGGQWLTVREFAARAGVSIQAVYQRLDKDLSSYLKSEKGRKYIHSDALQFVGNSSACQANSSTCQVNSSATCQALDKHLTSADQTAEALAEMQARLDAAEKAEADARAALDTAQNQLEQTAADLAAARDQRDAAERKAAAADAERKRADAAEQQLTVKDKQIETLQSQLASALSIIQTTQAQLDAAHALQAGQIQLALKTGQTVADGAQPAPDPITAEAPATDQPGEEQRKPAEEKKKRGVFARFFGRHKGD